MTTTPYVLERWHECIKKLDFKILDEILADDAVLFSPVVHTPQSGKPIVKMYLMAAASVFVNKNFNYTKKIIGNKNIML